MTPLLRSTLPVADRPRGLALPPAAPARRRPGVSALAARPVDFTAFPQAIPDLGRFRGFPNEPPPRGARSP